MPANTTHLTTKTPFSGRNDSSRNQLRSRERGASEIFILMMMSTMLAFAGLAYDAGMAFNARRHAQNVAASAARIGANQIETDALYQTGIPLLDRSDAERAARNRISLEDDLTVIEANATGVRMEVKLRTSHATTFLHIIGIDTLTVEAEAVAMAESLSRS